MNEVRNLLVGLEVGKTVSRICFYDRTAKEPVPCAARTGTNLYAYPTVVVRQKDEWHIGYEAEYLAGSGSARKLPSLFEMAENREVCSIGSETLTASDVLRVFISESLKMLGVHDVLRSVSGLALTTENLTPAVAVCFKEALKKLGIDRNRCFIQDEKESFYYYGYSQKPEICVRNMGLIRFRGDQASFFSLTEMRNTKPFAAAVDYRGSVTLPKDPEKRDEEFEAAAEEWVSPGNYSGIFITGDGFGTEWADKSVRTLSRGGAHVFYSDSFFAEGACWSAVERLERKSLRNRIYMGPDLVRTSVGTDVSDAGRPLWYPLVRSGVNWYENESSCELVLDGSSEIVFTTVSMDGSARGKARLLLEGLEDRPPLAARVSLSAFCPDCRTCRITVKDMGFGEIFASTGRTWNIDIEI